MLCSHWIIFKPVTFFWTEHADIWLSCQVTILHVRSFHVNERYCIGVQNYRLLRISKRKKNKPDIRFFVHFAFSYINFKCNECNTGDCSEYPIMGWIQTVQLLRCVLRIFLRVRIDLHTTTVATAFWRINVFISNAVCQRLSANGTTLLAVACVPNDK